MMSGVGGGGGPLTVFWLDDHRFGEQMVAAAAGEGLRCLAERACQLGPWFERGRTVLKEVAVVWGERQVWWGSGCGGEVSGVEHRGGAASRRRFGWGNGEKQGAVAERPRFVRTSAHDTLCLARQVLYGAECEFLIAVYGPGSHAPRCARLDPGLREPNRDVLPGQPWGVRAQRASRVLFLFQNERANCFSIGSQAIKPDCL